MTTLSKLGVPFNIRPAQITKESVAQMQPVTSMDIFDGASDSFHPQGLYSTEIFGKFGDKARMTTFSYIDVKAELMHPIIYRSLISLKGLYQEILEGKTYAKWNEELGDFEKSNEMDGDTGYSFFLKKLPEIKFRESASDERTMKIRLIKKYQDKMMTRYMLVAPAGIRDVEIDDSGLIQKNDINAFYVSFLSQANAVSDAAIKLNPEILDRVRSSMQKNWLNLFEAWEAMLDGKQKLIQGKWAARRIHYGTRNVLTAQADVVRKLGDPGYMSFNKTVVGLYQTMKAMLPKARYYIRNGFLNECFTFVGGDVTLVDPKTLKQVNRVVDKKYYDIWMTNEGLEKVMTSFQDESIRDKPVMVDGYYLGLIYKGPDGTFKMFHGIDELPEGFDKKYVSPITMCELFYLSAYRNWNKQPILVTRYPVNNIGSIYPSFVLVKTTIRDERRRELGPDWKPLEGPDNVAYSFPIPGPYINSLVPHQSRLKQLGADHDGDTGSANIPLTEDSREEIEDALRKRGAYLNSKGAFLSSANTDITELVMRNLTKF